MAVFVVTDELTLGRARTGLASSVRYTVTDAGGVVRVPATNSGVTELTDFAGAATTGTYPISFAADSAWSWPLRVAYRVNGQAGIGLQSTIGLDVAALLALGYGADRAARLDYLDVAVSSRSTYVGTASPATATTAAAWAALASVYCTDEDIAVRAMADYPSLCPDHQRLAGGTDGTITAPDRWTLRSATVDFNTSGVHPGNVAWLTAPRTTFRNDGELFAVEAVNSDGGATLRRIGKGAGVGQPPAPAAGLTGVAFEVLTFDRQIDDATYEIMRWFAIDPTYPELTPFDVRELNQLCVLWVLQRAYGLQVKTKESDYALKLARIDGELEDLRSRVSLRWGPRGVSGRAGGAFGARAGR